MFNFDNDEDVEELACHKEAREYRSNAFSEYSYEKLAALHNNAEAQGQFMLLMGHIMTYALDCEWHYDLTKRKFGDCDNNPIAPKLQFDKVPKGIEQFKSFCESLNPRRERLCIKYVGNSTQYKLVTTFGK